jgi:Uncharacterized conserved protein
MKIFLIIVIVMIIAIIILVAYYGGFYKLRISVDEAGGETLVYESLRGNYKKSGTVMDKIYWSLLNNEKIETYKGFGIYYDNPQKVEEAELRSEAGCILEDKDTTKIPMLEKKYTVRKFPKKKYIITEFPYKGKLSVMFSLFKVYPALASYAINKGYKENGAVMEIYDIPNNKIQYRKEIAEN